MTNAFSSLKRISKPKTKAAPLHTPPSSSPAPQSRPPTAPRAQLAKAPVKPSEATSTASQGKRSKIIEETSSDEELEEPAPPKKKRKNKRSTQQAEDPPAVDHSAAQASEVDQDGTVISFDPEGLRRLERVLSCATQPSRIENGVEGLFQLARLLPRYIGDDVRYKVVLPKGLARDGKYRDDDPELTKPVWNEYWQVRVYFERIKELFPVIADNTAYLRQSPDLVTDLAAWMTTVSRKARSDDLGRVKEYLLEVIEFVDTKGLKEKTNRGFKHPETARLLCPVRLLEKFDNDPEEFCRSIRNKKRNRSRVKGTKWPLFMYDMKLYDPKNQFAGFLRSKEMLRFFQIVYTGPSSATDSYSGGSKNRGKPPIASKIEWDDEGIHILTIVYVATLVRFSLNAQTDWQDVDGDFETSEFVTSVLTGCLRDPDWRDELTQWYTRRVLERSSSDDKDSDEDDEPSAFDLMLAEVDARNAAKAARSAARTEAAQEPPREVPPASEAAVAMEQDDAPPTSEDTPDGLVADQNTSEEHVDGPNAHD